MLIDQIIYARRKTIAIMIKADGQVIVRAPLRAPEFLIHNFVNSKKTWIEKKRTEILAKIPPDKKFIEAEEFYYLGEKYRLEFCNAKQISLQDGKLLFPQKYRLQVREKLIKWYKLEAKNILSECLDFYVKKTGWQYLSFKINHAKTRWGSCAGNNSLNFSYRLISFPLEVVDYVVV
ncbi:MAG TPA: SprT family zinc-dependent metalloprotease, partial [Candidatus Gracilibacteria bacterium]|nr:SprT family zinc-dependent metalloprotease [Candidatus Gracilibacteria bacterium]